MPSLAAAMIVKNEEQFIARVIQNIQPVCDEIVITDTGSSDNTIDIIKKSNAKLFYKKWNGDASRVRNFTISKCNTGWILFIDADEFVDIHDYGKIRRIICRDNNLIAYWVILRYYTNPGINLEDIFKKDWKGSYVLRTQIRIFRNRRRIFYSMPTYPTLEDSLRGRTDKVGESGVIFHHFNILRHNEKKIEKTKRYHDDVFKNFKSYPDNPDAIYALAHYYMLNGEFNKAIRYYQEAIKLKPQHLKAKLALGFSYVALGKETKGINIIRSCRDSRSAFLPEVNSYLNSAYSIIFSRVNKNNK